MDLFDAVCLTLWWAEGTKIRKNKRWGSYIYSIEITNTDPVIIALFLKFLREKMNIQNQRIKVQLQIHSGDNQSELEKFWEETTNIPNIRPVGNKIGKSRGTCKIRIHSKSLFLELDDRLNKLRGVVHR
jgi:hypothetical protein